VHLGANRPRRGGARGFAGPNGEISYQRLQSNQTRLRAPAAVLASGATERALSNIIGTFREPVLGQRQFYA
jgi:hypothetical protein